LKKIISLLRSRVAVVALGILLQLLLIIVISTFFSLNTPYYYVLSIFLSIILTFSILNTQRNPSYQLAWIIPVLIFPVFGGILYWLFGARDVSKKEKKILKSLDKKVLENKIENNQLVEELTQINPDAGHLSHYIQKFTYLPPSNSSQTTYYPSGESFFRAFKDDLRAAEHYIFMEFFILDHGKMWSETLEILKERIDKGVEVRLILDDVGTLFRLSSDYIDELRDSGLQVEIFNPVKPRMSLKYNMREHRKIIVIDGKVGYTGGLNMGDEYINEIQRFGYWKDNAIRVKGEAVWNFVIMFLSLWEFLLNIDEDYETYKPKYPDFYDPENSLSIVQPFSDDPTHDEPLAETIYLNMIYKAKESVYIKTPYLVLSNNLLSAILNASKSGIDVKIILPGIPDKKFVYEVSQSFYTILIDAGVSIYEYTPGFIHEKVVITDRKTAVIGTINMNYRSTHLDFESAVWLHETNSVTEMSEEFLGLLPICKKIDLETAADTSWYQRTKRRILRLFAPLM